MKLHGSARPPRRRIFRARLFSHLPACLLIITCLVAGSGIALAQVGDLLVAPTRAVFEGRKRTMEIALVNIGNATATYRVSLINQRMTEDGRFQEIDEPLPGELFCGELIRFTPRQVTLDPRATQVVRLQVRKPENLAPGEYRSHLLLRAVPAQAPVDAPDDEPAEGIGINLIPVYGVSIAVIVRHETKPATVQLSGLNYTPAAGEGQQATLSFEMNRSGNQSVYGDILVAFTPEGSRKPVPVARAMGVAVYSPNPRRLFTLPLSPPEELALRAGTLSVAYRLKAEDGGALLAEGSLVLP